MDSDEGNSNFPFDLNGESSTQAQWHSIILQLRKYISEIFEDEANEGSEAGAGGSDSVSTDDEIAGRETDLQDYLDDLSRKLKIEPVSKLVLVGDNGIGKSFLANLLLLLTSQSEKEYGLLPRRKEMEERGECRGDDILRLKSNLLLYGHLAGLRDYELTLRECDNFDLGEDLDEESGFSLGFVDHLSEAGVVQIPEELDNQGKLPDVGEEKRTQEMEGLRNLKEAWRTWPTGDRETSQYIVPSKQGTQTTTANQINIRHGSVFHFWIRYKSKLSLREDVNKLYEEITDPERDNDDDVSELTDKKKKYKVLTGKRFKSSDRAADLCPEIQEVCGKDVIISGRGFNALDDRIYVRDKLCEKLLDSRTSCAIKECYVYCPSELLERGMELIDAPGSNDSDPFKKGVLAETLSSASNVLCIAPRVLSAQNSILGVLREHGIFQKMLKSEEENDLFKFLAFWPSLEKDNCMTADKLVAALSKPTQFRKNLESGEEDMFNSLSEHLWNTMEQQNMEMDDDDFEELMRVHRPRVMGGLILLWASLCMDEQRAKIDLDSIAKGRYTFVYGKTNGDALLKALFNVRPQPDNVLDGFLKYVRSTAKDKFRGKNALPPGTLEKAEKARRPAALKGVDARFQTEVVDKLWQRVGNDFGNGRNAEEGRKLKEMLKPLTSEAKPATIAEALHKYVSDPRQTPRKDALKNAFDPNIEKTSGIAVWNRTFQGWFPKPQSAEVEQFTQSLNATLNEIIIGPSDAVSGERRSMLLEDMEQWLMREVLRALDGDETLHGTLQPFVQTMAKRILQGKGLQPNAKVGWVPKNSVHKLLERAKSNSVKPLCTAATKKANDLASERGGWRRGYAQAISTESMQGLVAKLAEELHREAGQVVRGRVRDGVRHLRGKLVITLAQKAVKDCLMNIIDAFKPNANRDKQYLRLKELCDDVQTATEFLVKEDRQKSFDALLQRIKRARRDVPEDRDLFKFKKKRPRKSSQMRRPKAKAPRKRSNSLDCFVVPDGGLSVELEDM